jgi:hypothetical protein
MPDERNRTSRAAEVVRRWWLPALLAVAAMATAGIGWAARRDWHEQSLSESKTGRPTTLITLGFGPQQVWRPSQATIAELHKCADPISLNCVHTVMEQSGASADAFEFYHLTGWFLLELKSTDGPVMLAMVADPWRANENEQPALVGGHPVIVYPEDVQVPVEDDAGFKALKADFPLLWFWKSGPTLETNAVTVAGERFVFRYRLLDGCRACAIRGWARIEFAFGPDGTYQPAKLLDVVRQ